MLNRSHALLKQDKFAEAVAQASEVVALDKRSLKGFYRRGAAKAQWGKLAEAVEDLTRATLLAPEDKSVAFVLADARAKALEAGVDVAAAEAAAKAAHAAMMTEPEVTEAGPAGGLLPGSSPAERMAHLKANPDALKGMGDMMANMTDADFAQMSANGPPGMPVRLLSTARAPAGANPSPQKLTPEMARMAGDMFKNMKPEDMEKMMDMASKFGGGMLGGAGGAGGAGGMPDMETASKLMSDPDSMKMVGEMMKNISPEALASMSSQMGMKMSPEDAKAMTEQLANMKPEHMAKILAFTSFVQRAAAKAKAARDWLRANPTAALALLALFFALLVRRWMARAARRAGMAPPAAASPADVDDGWVDA